MIWAKCILKLNLRPNAAVIRRNVNIYPPLSFKNKHTVLLYNFRNIIWTLSHWKSLNKDYRQTVVTRSWNLQPPYILSEIAIFTSFDKIYEYLDAIYTTIIEKDITQRHQINDKRAFANIVKFVASNIGNQLSPSNISKTLKQDGQNIHHATVEKYLDYLVTSFVFYKVNRFDLKGKKQLATQEKYYIVDAGLLNVLVGKERITERGHILENIVYLELIRRGYKVWTGTARNTEVDFVCKNSTGEIEYYQVAWQISNESTLAT